jgi:hypothetical protein
MVAIYLLQGKEIIQATNFYGHVQYLLPLLYRNDALEWVFRCFVGRDGKHHNGELGNRIVQVNNIQIDIILYMVTCLFSCLSFN